MLTGRRGSPRGAADLHAAAIERDHTMAGDDVSLIDSLVRGVRIAVIGLRACNPIAPVRS